MQQRRTERELSDLREKLAIGNRNLESANVNNIAQEATINQLRGTIDGCDGSSFVKPFSPFQTNARSGRSGVTACRTR